MTVSGPDLERIEAILRRACGLSLSPALRRGLGTAVGQAAAAMKLTTPRFLQRLLTGDAECVSWLVEHSVIGETYFFRHPEQLAGLRARLERDFVAAPALRLWSAGCASGEEPYSLAMTLLDLGRSRKGDRVLGTDVSERALRLARRGVYGGWSLRRLDDGVRRRHFDPAGEERIAVKDQVKELVEFRRHNLLHDPAPIGGCHAVLCRNVLIYFEPATVAHVLRTLADALAPGGYLVLGPVEVTQAATLPLEWVEVEGATLLRRPAPSDAPKARPKPARPEPARAPAPPRAAKATKAARPPALAPSPAPAGPASQFERAREAARLGRLDEAERLAREAARSEQSPESYLLLSMAADSRGDLKAAVDEVRKALYLEPSLATGHALLVALYGRLGRPGEAERARRNALSAIEGLDEATVLKGVEGITAGALRRALETPARR